MLKVSKTTINGLAVIRRFCNLDGNTVLSVVVFASNSEHKQRHMVAQSELIIFNQFSLGLLKCSGLSLENLSIRDLTQFIYDLGIHRVYFLFHLSVVFPLLGVNPSHIWPSPCRFPYLRYLNVHEDMLARSKYWNHR